MKASRIEWTESTWNPVTGCSKISSGCLNCYAERMARRLQAMGQLNYRNGFEITCHPELLSRPLEWRRPQMVFVNSMGDLFHEDVPESFIRQVFEVIQQAHWHQFQILTKRSQRLRELAPVLDWPDNVWMGVTVENDQCRFRIQDLRAVPASTRFLSLEPLLGPIADLDLTGIDWIIVGGESGPGARPMQKGWIGDIHAQCTAQGIPFFFKQWGGINKKKAGRILDGRIWEQMPSTRQPVLV